MRVDLLRIAFAGVVGGIVSTAALVSTATGQDAARANTPSRSTGEYDKAINAKLARRIPMLFDETPLEDILLYVEAATMEPLKKGQDDLGIPIYVEPKGLREVGCTMTSTISIDLEDRPLATCLKRALAKLELDYIVKGGVVFISSAQGIARERKAPDVFASDDSKDTKEVLAILNEPLSMPFHDEIPLEDVLEYVRQAAKKGPSGSGIQFDVDEKGLQKANRTKTTTIRAIELDGVPLKTSLRLLLTQIDLAYVVKDGVVIISSPEGIQKLTKKAAR